MNIGIDLNNEKVDPCSLRMSNHVRWKNEGWFCFFREPNARRSVASPGKVKMKKLKIFRAILSLCQEV